MLRVEHSMSKVGSARGASVLLPFVGLALSLAAGPGEALAAAWADGDPYLAYGYQDYVIVVDTNGDQLYTIVPTPTSNFGWVGAGTVADPDPLNPSSKDIVIKGHLGGMARFTVGLTSATQVWVNNFSGTTEGSGMADSMVWGPDGKIYRQHQWGNFEDQTVNTYDASNGGTLLTNILETNPSGTNILVGGICFGLPGEADLANRLYVSWHTRPAAPADWGLVVAEFVNSSPADLSGTWSEQMYDENGVRDAGGAHHFMESADTSSTEAWEILSVQWGYYNSQPTLFVVGKNDQTSQHFANPGWGGRYPYGADNVGITPDNWMNVDNVPQCVGMQLGARTGIDDRVAYVLHGSGTGDGLQRWDMDDTDGNAFVSTFAPHGANAGSGVNIIGPVTLVMTVSVAATDDAAAEPSDYTALSGTVTILTGELTATVTVTPMDDAAYEGDETVTITVETGADYDAGAPASATVTISDDESATVWIEALTASVTEDTLTPTDVFTIYRSGGPAGDVTVTIFVDGTAAIDGTDYTLSPATTTIVVPDTGSATIQLTTTDDTVAEPTETVEITLIADTGSPETYFLGAETAASVAIIDDELPAVTIVATTDTTLEGGSAPGVFTLSRTGSTVASLTVDLAVAGTGSAGVDYVSVAGAGDIPAGSASVTIDITPINDMIQVGDRTVEITIVDSPGNYVVGALSQDTVTIVEDDIWIQAFNLTSPDGSADLEVDEEQIFTWTEGTGAESYELLISTDDVGFTNPISAQVLTNRAVVDAGTFDDTTTYYWKVTATSVPPEDATLDSAEVFSFTTQDNIGPTVQGTSPRSGTTDIGVSDDIGITFNEDIDEAAMQQDWVTVTGGVSGQVTMAGNRTIVFTPNSDLAAETLHTVTVSASVVDMAGNGLAAPYVFSFTTWQDLVGFAKGDGCAPGAVGTAAALVTFGLAAAALLRRRPSTGSGRRRRESVERRRRR